MFSPESYLTPYITAYLGKYVDNFNTKNFQLSIWEGEATFQNVDLKLDAIKAELQFPFEILSGHIHEMKISIPWTKITSEPIVFTLNTFEMSIRLKNTESYTVEELPRPPVDPKLPPDTTGYMQGLMNKIIQNAKIICHNVILKYIGEDFVLSFNFENVTLCSVNDNWEQAFIDVGGTEFIVRRKLTCPDLTVCLDSVQSIFKSSYTEPFLYKCAFDVRIFNKFETPFSKVPLLKRIDILFNDIDVCVTEEQIPWVMRIYNLLIALTKLHRPDDYSPVKESNSNCETQEIQNCNCETQGTPGEPKLHPSPATSEDKLLPQPIPTPVTEELITLPTNFNSTLTSELPLKVTSELSFSSDSKSVSTIVSETDAEFQMGLPVPASTTTTECIDEKEDEGSSLYDWASWAVGWIPVPNILGSTEFQPLPQPVNNEPLLLNVGLYINSTTVTVKMTDRMCGGSTSSSTTSSLLKTIPFLKCYVQGIKCDIVVQGIARSVRGGFSKFSIDGIGYCPCGVKDCIEEPPQFPINQNIGITYLSVGKVNENFVKGTLFDDSIRVVKRNFYKCRFHCKGYEDKYTEEHMLEATPGIALDSVELLPRLNETEEIEAEGSCCLEPILPSGFETMPFDLLPETDSDLRIAFEEPKSRVSTRVMIAPIRIKVATGFIHRLKVIVQAAMSYNYCPFEQILDLYLPDLQFFMKLRMDQFQLLLYDGDTGLIKDASHQIVMEFTGIKTNFRVKKQIFSKFNFYLQKLNIRNYKRKFQSNDWDLGDCLGVIMSCDNEIQQSIQIAQSSSESSSIDSSSTVSTTILMPSRSTILQNQILKVDERVSSLSSKTDCLFSLSHTVVEAAHYHDKCLSQDLIKRWNKVIEGKQGKESDLWIEEDMSDQRFISELDVKVKPMDFILSPAVLVPFIKLAKELVSVILHERQYPKIISKPNLKSPPIQLPSWNNLDLPLIYIKAGKVRVFFKTSEAISPNMFLLQIPLIHLTSQVDNPLHRHCVRPDLLSYAQEANISTFPGSFLEDRRYELSLQEISISTCTWKDVESNSLKLVTAPSVDDVISMRVKQSFEINSAVLYPVISFPFLDKFESTVSFSPAILLRLPNSNKTTLVAGYGAEINFYKEIHITANTHQLALLCGLYLDWVAMGLLWEESLNFTPEPLLLPESTKNEVPEANGSETSSVKEVDSGVESTNVPRVQMRPVIPFDLFLAVKGIRIRTYNLIYTNSGEKSVEQDVEAISAMKPLLMFNIIQPYAVCSITSINKKIEFSIFDFTVEMGSGTSRTANAFTIPSKFEYPVKLFQTLQGERNPKTGMVRPILTCTMLDFQSLKLNCDIARPIKFVLSYERLHHLKELHGSVSDHLISSSLIQIDETPSKNRITIGRIVNIISMFLPKARVVVNQIVFVILEEPSGLPKAAVTVSITGVDATLRRSDNARVHLTEKVYLDGTVDSLVITTLIGDRTDVFMNPWKLRLKIIAEWHSLFEAPVSTVALVADPITLFFGPQNILAFLQVYHTFGKYLRQFIRAEKREVEEILESISLNDTQSFSDDLRKGLFQYVYVINPTDVPTVYQVSICNSHGTITWRYPNPRYITSIDVLPVPILESSSNYSKNDLLVKLNCDVEYWDEAHEKFLIAGKFTVSESKGGTVALEHKEIRTHPPVSTMWRITIQTRIDKEELKVILTPEGLAGSICVNSRFSSKSIPKLALVFDIPRLGIHFMNHRAYAGKIPESRLSMYTMDGFNSQLDQSFATLDATGIQGSVSLWSQNARIKGQGFVGVTVTDYAHLTDINVIDPFKLHCHFNYIEEHSKAVYKGIKIMSNPVVLKVGASTLHTIITSTLTWMQVLKAYYGDVVDTSRNHFQTHVNMAQMLICNDTDADLGIIQAETKKSFTIGGRHCYAFTWTTQKVRPEVRVGISEEASWTWSQPFPLNRDGIIVRMLRENSLFVIMEHLYASQMLVTIYGPLSVANALDVPLEIGLLGRSVAKEIIWTVDSRSHGPSRLLHVRDVTGLRFKLTNLNGKQHGWSHSLTIEELRSAPNQAKSIVLYEEVDGNLTKYNIWCSLVEETLEGACRCLVILSPIFRLRSFLSSRTIARIGTAKNESRTTLELSGRGSEVEMDFLGEDTVAHLLTFQTDPSSPVSSPAIPLLPGGGPCMNSPVDSKRSINDILKDISLAYGVTGQVKALWPFTREGFDVGRWLQETQENPSVNVTFKPWIAGIPSVLVEAKPDAIFANLTGYTLLFREGDEDRSIINRSAFSPKNTQGKFSFGFNCFNRLNSAVWSEELHLTKYQSPTDIHHVNSDWKIPMNCFSRLEINGKYTQIHLTIETIVHEGILILTIRPTFNIQNRTKFALSVCGISLSKNEVPSDKLLRLDENTIPLESNDPEVEMSETSIGLLKFNCDWDTIQENIYVAGMKYIALQYGSSPWWFVRLMKFETIFDNLSAPKGIPVKRIALAMPSCQPHWASGNPIDLIEVTLALSICWTCKNGQVWISVAVDENPQVVIQNESQIAICYSEAMLNTGEPQIEYEHFPQFRCLAPRTTGFFAFPSLQSTFPEVMQNEPKVSLIFGVPTENYKVVRRLTMLCRDPKCIEWSTPVKCEDVEEVQLIHISSGPSKVYLKVLAEKLGLTYYVYIEELSDAEVSARDVRARISGLQSQESEENMVLVKENTTKVRFLKPEVSRVHRYDPADMNQLLTPEQLALEITSSNTALQLARSPNSMSDISVNVGTNVNPFYDIKIHFPELRFIFTDDFTQLGQKREIVSLIITDIFVERLPKHGERLLRVLKNQRAEFYQMILRVGDLQLDNALFQEKRYDFPVLLKRNDVYVPSITRCKATVEKVVKNIHKVSKCTFSDQMALIKITTEFLITAPVTLERLHSVELALQSFTVNIEDRFIGYILPVFENFTCIIKERFSLLQTENSILVSQRQRHTVKSDIAIPVPMSEEKQPKSKSNLPILFSNRNSISIVELLSVRRLSLDSNVSSPSGLESPGLRSPSIEDENDSLRIHHSITFNLTETYDRFSKRPIAAEIVAEYVTKLETKIVTTDEDLDATKINEESLSARLLRERPSYRANYMPIPEEIVSIIKDLAVPVQLQKIEIHGVNNYLTFRGRYKGMYFAFDNSPILLSNYTSNYVMTTMFTLGKTFGYHYLMGAIYHGGNSMRLIGSLELIGSPGTLVRSVGAGVKDFVVYPVQGIVNGPFAFITGLNNGCSSLVRNISSGTLTSVTNFAWSVSRNIDRWTLDEDEQLLVEETRRVPIDGITDGLIHGFTGFGIRLLGAVGGIAHHTLQAATEEGASPMGIVTGIGKGLIGVVTKPVGATMEFVAMTGQGLLQEAGWTHTFTRKYEVYVEETGSCSNSLLKYRWKLGLLDREPGSEKIILVVDGTDFRRNSQQTPIAIVITTQNVYIIDTALDHVQKKDSISATSIKSSDFHLSPNATIELFNLLKLSKRIQDEEIFGVFDKTSTTY